jgi:hypothetical protein
MRIAEVLNHRVRVALSTCANLPVTTRGWRGQCAYADAAYRVHARVEDVIRTGKDTGLGHFPSRDYKINQAWLDAAMTACILLAWLKLIALDGDLARAEPKSQWNPGNPARQPGRRHAPPQKSRISNPPDDRQRQPSAPMKDQG